MADAKSDQDQIELQQKEEQRLQEKEIISLKQHFAVTIVGCDQEDWLRQEEIKSLKKQLVDVQSDRD